VIIDVRPGASLATTKTAGEASVRAKPGPKPRHDAKQRNKKALTRYGPTDTIGDWTILRRVYKPKDKGNVWWRVQCKCGKEETLRQRSMLYGKSPRLNCGCDKGEAITARNQREYHTWQNMLARCYDPKHPSYPRYGGRGIGVCPEWRDRETGFQAFLAFMGKRPTDGHSIDRADPSKDYGPDNPCSWQTIKVQNRNKERTVWVTDPDTGDPIKAADLAEKWGMRYQTMRARMMTLGLWPAPTNKEEEK
jgi:hypothetical protein